MQCSPIWKKNKCSKGSSPRNVINSKHYIVQRIASSLQIYWKYNVQNNNKISPHDLAKWWGRHTIITFTTTHGRTANSILRKGILHLRSILDINPRSSNVVHNVICLFHSQWFLYSFHWLWRYGRALTINGSRASPSCFGAMPIDEHEQIVCELLLCASAWYEQARTISFMVHELLLRASTLASGPYGDDAVYTTKKGSVSIVTLIWFIDGWFSGGHSDAAMSGRRSHCSDGVRWWLVLIAAAKQ